VAQRGSNGVPRAADLRVVSDKTYASWDEIYLDNVSRIYRLMYAKVANRSDAEDLTTEVFMAALGPLRTEASRGEVRAYLLTTAQTVLATFWRRRIGTEVTTIDLVAALDWINDPAPAGDAPARARRVLARLPERYRRILELRFLELRSIKEAAQEMEVTVSNAKVLQHRALRMAAEANEAAGP
jgi:RNA polymerase sigma factor (sigma-70 family)